MHIVTITEFSARTLDAVVGGLDTRLLNLLLRIADHHKVTVICSRRPGDDYSEQVGGVTFRTVGGPRTYTPRARLTSRMIFLQKAASMLHEIDPDLVHGDGLVGTVASIMRGASRGVVPRVATVHEIRSGIWGRH